MLGDGTKYIAEYWGRAVQNAILTDLAQGLAQAPFFRPTMPRTGQPWSIVMTNLGALGWVSDRDGYRYQEQHPQTDAAWPAIPASLIDLWFDVTGYRAPPECCLVNYYDQAQSKMGLHRDADEAALDAPVVSISLGDSATFRMGGTTRKGPTRSLKLHSGDVFMFGGPARHYFHGIDRIFHGSSTLLAEHSAFAAGGRINLTLRRVTKPE
jgi:alkylated DNA repair protein (DNA oxidative demethylase)